MAHSLFPIDPSQIITGFTTSPSVSLPHITYVALGDKTLRVHKVWNRTTHQVVTPPPPTTHPHDTSSRDKAWLAHFPAGSINPNNKFAPPGGFGFYVHGPKEFHERMKEEKPREVVMGYEVMFEDGFGWVLGGKLPGVCTYPSSLSHLLVVWVDLHILKLRFVCIDGGSGDFAYGCTGGRQTDRCKCFNLRLMWRYVSALHLPHFWSLSPIYLTS